MPFVFVNPKDYDKIEAGAAVELKGLREAVAGDGTLTATINGKSVALKTTLSPREKSLILAGGLLASLSAK